jgi:transposase
MSKYTPTMIAELREAQPLNLEKAQTFSAEWGVSYRSIIAKVLSLGLTYEKKAVRASSSDRPTKADIVREIERSLQGENLDGLQGASMRSLQNLLMSIG